MDVLLVTKSIARRGRIPVLHGQALAQRSLPHDRPAVRYVCVRCRCDRGVLASVRPCTHGCPCVRRGPR
eukprot:7305794-Alexandrium_andersonii.AAC.1